MQPVQEKKAREILEEIIHRLVQVYRPEQIYLFGSVARGEAGADSDFDIMVVVSNQAPAEKQRSRLAYQALRGTGVAADILVWTKKSFEERLHLQASLPATIMREGKLLYAA
jgi:predicted nucleotidyltransferase